MKRQGSGITFKVFCSIALLLHHVRQKLNKASASLNDLVNSAEVSIHNIPDLLSASGQLSQTIGVEEGIKNMVLLIWDEDTWMAIDRAANFAPDDVKLFDSAGVEKMQGEYVDLRLRFLQ